jgi:hypothetical protein
MLVQENYKDNVSFERVQRTLYQLSKDDDLKDWRKKLVYRRLFRLTQDFIQRSSESFTLYNRSYIGSNGGVLELYFRVPTYFDGFSTDDILFVAESMCHFAYVIDRFKHFGLQGSVDFQNVDQFSLDLAVVIPVDFVENYNN